MKETFSYNLIKGKDVNDKDIQWWEEMEDGTQLQIPLSEDDADLVALIVAFNEKEDKNVNDCLKAIALINAKMPNIYIDMKGYVKRSHFFVRVGTKARENFFCFSTNLTENQIAISWNICDICGYIARFFKSRSYNDRLILLSKKTHITDLKIEKDEDGDIIITPTIENL